MNDQNYLDYTAPELGYPWLPTLSRAQWNTGLGQVRRVLDAIGAKKDDDRITLSFRDEGEKRFAVICGMKYISGFYFKKDEVRLRFYIGENFDISPYPELVGADLEFKDGTSLATAKMADFELLAPQFHEASELDLKKFAERAGKSAFKRIHLPWMWDVIYNADAREEFLAYVESKPQERILRAFKSRFIQDEGKDEWYKWELVKKFRENWDLGASDFSAMLGNIDFGNLLDNRALAFIREAAKHPEEAREYFKFCMDESIPENERIAGCKARSAELLKKWRPKWNVSGQDERTLSVLWTFNDPEKHVLYKASIYTAFCRYLGIKSRKAGNRYEHYRPLLQKFVAEHIMTDDELMALHKEYIPQGFADIDPKNQILGQTIVYVVLEQMWANKKESDEKETEMNEATSEKKYWLYSPGENTAKWEEFSREGVIGIGWDELGDLVKYKSKAEMAAQLRTLDNSNGSKKNDATANDSFANIVSKGDIVIVKSGLHGLLGYGQVESDYYFDQNASDHKSRRRIHWKNLGSWIAPFQMVTKTLTDITEIRAKTAGYQMYHEELIGIMNGEAKIIFKPRQPLNQILYGPPGTGKTYKLKSKFFDTYTTRETSITPEQHFENVASELSWWQCIALALLELKEAKTAQIKENRWVKHKVEHSQSMSLNAALWSTLQSHTIEESTTVKHKRRMAPLIFDKDEKSQWRILDEQLKEQAPELPEMLDSVNNFKPNPDKVIERYVFTTFHQSYGYEDFVEGIKPVMSEEADADSLGYRIEPGVFKKLCDRAAKDPENRYAIFIDEINRGNIANIFGELITLIEPDKRKGCENGMKAVLPYSKTPFSVPQNVDIIGTMNTADRSVEALDTALRRRFSFREMLPKPELIRDMLGEKADWEGISLAQVLTTINDRIEVLLDRDHTIGHSYFLELKDADDFETALKRVFSDKIIPLLQEYFYNDYVKIGMVLGSGFVETVKNRVAFASFEDSIAGEYDDKVRYTLVNMDDEQFKLEQALKTLLNTKAETSGDA